MKNKKILLPLLSSGALASTIAPTLTSCGTYSLLFAKSHNMLNDYINRVLPHSEMEIYGDNAAKNFYLSSVKNNTDVFKNDIMYTFASAFKNEACKTKLETEQLVKYTSYYIDIRNIAVDVGKETIGFSLDAYIKGTGLGNSVYKNFDIVFFNDFKVKFAFALSDASTVALKNDNWLILSVAKTDLIARLSASGTINKQNGTKVELNEETIYSGDSETQIPESVQIYKDLVLDLPHIAYDLGCEDSVVLPFASHYMQKIHLNS